MMNDPNVNDVLEGLRCCLAHSKNRCIKCPYYKGYGGFRTCTGDLMIDALAAVEWLKGSTEEQERKEPK